MFTMPSRNREKVYVADGFYHIYNRGINKRVIFKDRADYTVFLNLLKRYLSDTPSKDAKGREYAWLHDELELLAFCLMPNHFHLFIYQSQPQSMTTLLRSVATAYTTYFNKKYRRIGPLFQDRFKATLITNEAYFEHISRYIHLNPKQYTKWPYSSLPFYLGEQAASWVRPERIMAGFTSVQDYLNFLHDYESYKNMLNEIEPELAHL